MLLAFELSALMLELEGLLDNPESDPQQIEAIKNLLCQQGPQAIDDCAYLIKELEGNIDTIASRIRDLQARKKQKEVSIQRVREMLLNVVDTVFSGKVKTEEFSVSGVDKRTTTVTLVDEKAVPDAFWKRHEPELDVAKVKQAVKDGVSVPGVNITTETDRTIRIANR